MSIQDTHGCCTATVLSVPQQRRESLCRILFPRQGPVQQARDQVVWGRGSRQVCSPVASELSAGKGRERMRQVIQASSQSGAWGGCLGWVDWGRQTHMQERWDLFFRSTKKEGGEKNRIKKK